MAGFFSKALDWLTGRVDPTGGEPVSTPTAVSGEAPGAGDQVKEAAESGQAAAPAFPAEPPTAADRLPPPPGGEFPAAPEEPIVDPIVPVAAATPPGGEVAAFPAKPLVNEDPEGPANPANASEPAVPSEPAFETVAVAAEEVAAVLDSGVSPRSDAQGETVTSGGVARGAAEIDLFAPIAPLPGVAARSVVGAVAVFPGGEPFAVVPDSHYSPLWSGLVELLGEGKVSVASAVLDAHAGDKWSARHQPDVVVFAESAADVAQVMKFAQRRRVPVTTRGAGVGYVGGCVPVRGGIVLSTARMNRILGVFPEDGVAVVQPGVITADLQAAARAVGWEYPPDPASLKECSIGGNIATNAGGPRCLKYGVTRSYVLGLEVVLADGAVVRTGGRLHKNKTGFDLVGMFTGSEGMLGVITEATLRLIPKPQSRGMLAAVFPDFAQAAAAVQGILNAGHLPSALEITDSFTLEAARKRLGPGVFPPGDAYLMVEIDGRSAAVPPEIAELRVLLQQLGATAIECAPDDASCERLWSRRREFSYALRDTGLTKLNEDIVVPRSKLVKLVEFARMLERETGISIACFGHAGDGNIHTNLMLGDYHQPAVRERAEAVLDILFTWVLSEGGAITGEHGVGIAKKRWITQALGPAALEVHQRIKHALDSGNLLNPGKFLDFP